jgi:hypothetical protein
MMMTYRNIERFLPQFPKKHLYLQSQMSRSYHLTQRLRRYHYFHYFPMSHLKRTYHSYHSFHFLPTYPRKRMYH